MTFSMPQVAPDPPQICRFYDCLQQKDKANELNDWVSDKHGYMARAGDGTCFQDCLTQENQDWLKENADDRVLITRTLQAGGCGPLKEEILLTVVPLA
jgi:hypothetical protein